MKTTPLILAALLALLTARSATAAECTAKALFTLNANLRVDVVISEMAPADGCPEADTFSLDPLDGYQNFQLRDMLVEHRWFGPDRKAVRLTTTTAVSGKRFESSSAAITPDYEWLGLEASHAGTLEYFLGVPKQCFPGNFATKSTEQEFVRDEKSSCRVPTPDASRSSLDVPHFDVEATQSPEAIEVVYAKEKLVVVVPIASCEYRVAGQDHLLAGATEQLLILESRTWDPSCDQNLRRVSHLAIGDIQVPARVDDLPTSEEPDFHRTKVILGPIPTALEPSSGREAQLLNQGKTFGKIRLSVNAAIVRTSLSASYEVDSAYGKLFAAASGPAHTRTSDKGGVTVLATVNPLLSPAGGSPKDLATVTNTAGFSAWFGGCHLWRVWVDESSPARMIGKRCGDTTASDIGLCIEFETPPPELRFGTRLATSSITANAECLVKAPAEPPAPGANAHPEDADSPNNKDPTTEPARWLRIARTSLTLADGAEIQSIPIPASKLLQLSCDTEGAVVDGETLAMDNEAVRRGRCFLQRRQRSEQHPQRKDDAESQIDEETLALFGPQSLKIEVSRTSGSTISTSTTALSFESLSVPIPTPAEDDKASGPYLVKAYPTQSGKSDVVYRSLRSENATPSDPAEDRQFVFTATLRPRGLLGWPGQSLSVRTYITGSLAFTGFSFPAPIGELRTSEDPTAVAVLSPRVGLLFTVEPWNYRDGVNPWPANPMFQAGFNVFKFSGQAIDVSALIGAAASFPIISESSGQFGAKATAGVYLQEDLRDGSPHLLLSVGVNVLSLLSGSQK